MGAPALIIGSGSKYGKTAEITKQPVGRQQLSANPKLSRPIEIVDLYVGDVFVKEVLLKDLVRFSGVAKKACPKPKQIGKQPMITGGETNGNKTNITGGHGSKQPSGPNDNLHEAGEVNESNDKQLVLKIPDVLVQPGMTAIKKCLDWMELNRTVYGRQRLHRLNLTETDVLSDLIETYAAALCFELYPVPLNLRHELLQALTESPPTAATLNVLHRVITSVFEYEHAYAYTDVELQAIYEVAASSEHLTKRFNILDRIRKRHYGPRKRHNGRLSRRKGCHFQEDECGERQRGPAWLIGQRCWTDGKGVAGERVAGG